MTLIELIIFSAATWRLAHLLVDEGGPFDMFGKFRDLVGIEYDANSNPISKNVFAKGLTCIWCTSIWTASIFAFLHAIISGIWTIGIIAEIFAYSTFAILFNGVVHYYARFD